MANTAKQVTDFPRAIAWNKSEMAYWLRQAAKFPPNHDLHHRRLARAEEHRTRIAQLEAEAHEHA
jgi:hypothetical protein